MRLDYTGCEWFILSHSNADPFDWQVAAQQTLEKIAEFKQLPASEQPSLMTYKNWYVIEDQIRAIAQGGRNG